MIKNILLALVAILIFRCNVQEFAIKEHICGNYYLIATDNIEDCSLCYHMSKDGSNYGTVIEETIFSIGCTNEYIIAKQHPRIWPKESDKNITNYYILPLLDELNWKTMNEIIGPLTLEEFNDKRKELGIPDSVLFTKVIEDLK